MMAQAAQRDSVKLYTPRLLALSTELARFPLDDRFAHRAEVRSRTCGSTIEIGVDVARDGTVERLGLTASACAIGQSSAAIMALAAQGRSANELVAMEALIQQWLDGGADQSSPLPDWPGFDALEPTLPHKGRHGALMLAWTAMAQALSSGPSSR